MTKTDRVILSLLIALDVVGLLATVYFFAVAIATQTF